LLYLRTHEHCHFGEHIQPFVHFGEQCSIVFDQCCIVFDSIELFFNRFKGGIHHDLDFLNSSLDYSLLRRQSFRALS